MKRRSILNGVLALLAIPNVAAASIVDIENSGLVGDGVHHDGLAMANLFDRINQIPGSHPIQIRLTGQYLLAGAPIRPMAPSRFEGRPGDIIGLPALTRSNVTIDARGAVFKVPENFPFRRLKRGGDERDSFFVMFHFKGENCTLIGGEIDGSLDKRPIFRGPETSGFGGKEFGLVMEGQGWLLEDVTAKNWGTDCLLITTQGQSLRGKYSKARRNGISVVATHEVAPDNPIVIDGGTLSGNGNYPDDLANNPGAGAVVEGPAVVSAIFRDIVFQGNKLKDLQLAKNSFRCVVQNCTFSHDLKLRPLQLGGHNILFNSFLGRARIYASTTVRGAEEVCAQGNFFNGKLNGERVRFGFSKVKGSYFPQKFSIK